MGRTVDIHYESTTLDERTGEPFRWMNSWDEATAAAHVAKVNAGLMRDPFGKPWGSVRAEVGPFFCPKTLLTRCPLLARCVSACRAVAHALHPRRLSWA